MKNLFGFGLLGVVFAVFTLPASADDYDHYHNRYHRHYRRDNNDRREVTHYRRHREVVTPNVVVRVPGF